MAALARSSVSRSATSNPIPPPADRGVANSFEMLPPPPWRRRSDRQRADASGYGSWTMICGAMRRTKEGTMAACDARIDPGPSIAAAPLGLASVLRLLSASKLVEAALELSSPDGFGKLRPGGWVAFAAESLARFASEAPFEVFEGPVMASASVMVRAARLISRRSSE